MFTKRQKQIFDYIKQFIKERGYSPSLEEIRRHFRLSSRSTIHYYVEVLREKGYLNKLDHQARAIELPTEKKSIDLVEIPLLGTIAAGEPIEAIENPETIKVQKSLFSRSGEHYALKVQGDSMIDDGVFDGDIVIIRRQPTAENGETVVALLNDNEVTLKKIYREKNRFRLQPANPNIKPIFTKELAVQGKVVSVIRTFEELKNGLKFLESEKLYQDYSRPQHTFQKIIIGDSRKMKELKNESVDLMITSPPYWNLKEYGNGDVEKGYAQYIKEIEEVLAEVSRVLKPGRFACINLGTAVSGSEMKHIPSDVINIMRNLDFNFKKEVIWVKPKGTQGLWQRGTTKFLKREPYPGYLSLNIMHEYILIFQKKGEFEIDFDDNNKLSEEFIKKVCWSVWEMKVSYTKGHPAPFPEELPQRLIKLYSQEGDTVLDPFGGSGTVMKVAKELNRNSVIYEINPAYLELIKNKVGWKQNTLNNKNVFKLIIRNEKNAQKEIFGQNR